jgi:ribosome-binding factor A
MSSRRLLKAAEAIREVVSMAILTEIRDPRVQNVTVTGVEVAPDMKSATVSVSVMGDEGRQKLCLRGLQSSSGFLQSRIADRIDTRYTPRLTFSLDTGVKKSLEVERILMELAQERAKLAAERGEDPTGQQAENDLEDQDQPQKPPPATPTATDTGDAEI